VRRTAQDVLGEILESANSSLLGPWRPVDIAMRFLRTPTFLVRHMDIGASDNAEALRRAFETPDGSGLTLREKVIDFGRLLESQVDEEREELLSALESIQTGGIRIEQRALDPAEGGGSGEEVVPNVRLANGEVDRATRRRLMLAFNTPFFPEILVASSVMAEGVDLQLNCRHVVHHDLDWNPSVLEQRTGRLDRLGSKALRSGQSIVVYEPFVEATQDEKQYRVVKDRERWFNVLMGQSLELGEAATDRVAERVPLPEDLAKRLAMNLGLTREGIGATS
jgi:Helicase conserved C-terminal domain